MNDGRMNALAQQQPPSAVLGMKITLVSPERVTAELARAPRPQQPLRHHACGAIMALADISRRHRHTANLKDGQSTTTIESKTNFFASTPDRRHRLCGMHGPASRPHHHGLADPDHPRRRRLCALVTRRNWCWSARNSRFTGRVRR